MTEISKDKTFNSCCKCFYFHLKEFHDASDQFFDFYLGEDEDTSQRVQADGLEVEQAQQMEAAVAGASIILEEF